MECCFDIVIGNPPYVRHEKIKHIKSLLQRQGYKVFTSTADLYVYFYEKGYRLLKENGILAYITSNKWLKTKYGEKLRKFLKENTIILEVIDFSGYKVFELSVDTGIVIFRKEEPPEGCIFKFLSVPSGVVSLETFLEGIKWYFMRQDKLLDSGWTMGDERLLSLKEKIEGVGRPLKDWNIEICVGISTGCNEAFIIDTETRDKILASCGDEKERQMTEEIIKPVLRGRDLRKWWCRWGEKWVILTYRGIDIERYSSLKEYLSRFKDRLEKRASRTEWYELQRGYYKAKEKFEKEKIVWRRVKDLNFSYVDPCFYTLDSTFIIVGENLKYLIGLLNSKVIAWWVKLSAASLSDGVYGGKLYIEKAPIPHITEKTQPMADQIVQKVDEILVITQSSDFETSQEKQQKVKEFEREIDQLVYKLYGLTEEEIELVECNVSKDVGCV